MNLKLFFKPFFYGLIVLYIAGFLTSCDDESEMGMEVQPPTDQLGISYTDTLTLKTYSVREDSVRTDETSANLLGYLNDPLFGISYASFTTQFTMPTFSNLTFAGASIDSVVLTLAYNGIYGDTNTTYLMKIYELDEDIHKDSVYYSNKSFSHQSNNLANVVVSTNLKDSVWVGNVKKAPHLRIKLNNSVGQKIIDAAGTSHLANDINFKSFFKGLTIESQIQSGFGSIVYFDLLASNKLSALTIYYNDTLSYNFYPDAACARVNHFSHNYSGATNITNQLSDISLGQNICYIQPMSGLKTKISFPWINKLQQTGKYIINKAELVINVEDIGTNISEFPEPSRLVIVKNTANGVISFIPDQFEGDSYINGNYNSSKKQYTFNIARYFQDLMNGETDYGLYLMVSGASVKANRVVVKGGGNNSGRMKLNISYTKNN